MRKLNKIITTAAMVAAILAGTAPKAAAQCPYTVGPWAATSPRPLCRA